MKSLCDKDGKIADIKVAEVVKVAEDAQVATATTVAAILSLAKKSAAICKKRAESFALLK